MTMEFKCRPLLRPRPQMHRYPSGIAPLLYACWVALALFAGCSANEEKPAPPPLGVTIAPVVQKDVPIRQEWVGTMVGNVDAEIRPKVEGFLLTRLYTEGSYVEKGQPMFQLDKRQTQAAVEQATANLERARAALSQAQIDVRRFTPLVAQKAVSQPELDKATSSERAASATVDADQAALDNAESWVDDGDFAGLWDCGCRQGRNRRSDYSGNRDDNRLDRGPNLRYDSGLASYLEIIDAQIQMYPAERSAIIYDLGRKEALVNLYRALGGGWNLNDSQWTSTSGTSAPAQPPTS
jgi:Biotin-lipoyl like